MEMILKLSAREALDTIELISPLLERCAGSAPIDKKFPAETAVLPVNTTPPEAEAPLIINNTPTVQEASVAVVPTSAPKQTMQTGFVPTETHAYTRDELGRAAALLMDQGKQNDLIALLHKFEVNSLVALPETQFGAFAMALRELGAAI